MSTDSNGYPPSSLLHSCEEIKTQYPNSLSDYYTIIDGTGHARHVYCEMGQVCGSSGWIRVAYFNMSDPTEECPSGFRLYSQNGVRACGRPVTSGGSCRSFTPPTLMSADGYQKGTLILFFRIVIMEIRESTFGYMLPVYRKSLFMEVVNMNVFVLLVVHRQFLHL